jgi:hypothetical protein
MNEVNIAGRLDRMIDQKIMYIEQQPVELKI